MAQIQIKGTVTSADDGMPLPGTSFVVKVHQLAQPIWTVISP
jgi:hypothetical protein